MDNIENANVPPKAPKSSKSSATPKKTTAPKSAAPKTAGTTKTTTPKTTAAKPATPKTTASKSTAKPPIAKPSASKSTATKAPKMPGAPKSPVLPKTQAGKTADPKVAKQQNIEMSAEKAKEAELQNIASGKSRKRKVRKNVRKLIYIFITLLIISSVAVVSVVVIPSFVNVDKSMPDIILTDPGENGEVEKMKFEEEVKDYTWGDKINRGVAVKNTGNVDLLVCYKIEIFKDEIKDTPLLIDALPEFSKSIWFAGEVQELDATGKSITSKYYYFKNKYNFGEHVNSLTLFDEYKLIDTGVDANSFANKTVYSQVTVKYLKATEKSLNESKEPCWRNCPSAWKAGILSRL